MNIRKKLNILGYDQRWIDYGFLTLEELKAQFSDYSRAIEDPSEEANFFGWEYTEHLRYASFLKILEDRTSFTDQELERFIELVRCDDDQVMAVNVYAHLVKMKRVTAEQIGKFEELRAYRIR